ncbi:FHA domain-containing protein [Fusibacter sp. 3D3]|uniref:FHA domain-containing protein n=1 Tax=Fusibacter sp. 3D3 TaxID=1048380 RepID=UPI000853A2CE|nr:FHA domain-containing protein [Fusibacter sp. 3D3]GAU78997.1 hypothetical protein F3D3_3633 [Fusibacter sp. 3D3]
MTTKNEFHTEIIWGQSPDPIFLKMQQNIELKSLATLTQIRHEGDQYEFEYAIPNLVSVENLISTSRFNLRLFVHLLKTLSHLELQLEQYMLSGGMLLYRDDALYLDTTADQFVWILLPFNRATERVEEEQLHFFRHLLIELEQCHMPEVSILLMKTHFSISGLKAQYLSKANMTDLPHGSQKKAQSKFALFRSTLNHKFANKLLCKKRRKHQNEQVPMITQSALNLKKTSYVQRHPILISRDQPALQYKVYYETCLIGRDDRCEINIDETSISREHAKLYTKEATYLIEDLNSTNGTFVNNKKIMTKTPLYHGDELRIGHCDFIFLM